jgi:hypothetical protein
MDTNKLTAPPKKAAAVVFPSPTDPFSVDVKTFTDHLAINTSSAYAAAREAVLSFDAIEEKSIPKAFIFTGNALNTFVMLPAVTLGPGKAATAHFVEMGAQAYGAKGYG